MCAQVSKHWKCVHRSVNAEIVVERCVHSVHRSVSAENVRTGQ